MVDLYRHFDSSGNLLYVGESLSAIKRLSQHRNGSHWYERIVRVTIEKFPDKTSAKQAELLAITNEEPLFNKAGVPKKTCRPEPKPIRSGTDWSKHVRSRLELGNFECDAELNDGFAWATTADDEVPAWARHAAWALRDAGSGQIEVHSHTSLCRLIYDDLQSYYECKPTRRDIAELGYLKHLLDFMRWQDIEPQHPAYLTRDNDSLFVLWNGEQFAQEEWEDFLDLAHAVFWTLDQFAWTTFFGFFRFPGAVEFVPPYFQYVTETPTPKHPAST